MASAERESIMGGPGAKPLVRGSVGLGPLKLKVF